MPTSPTTRVALYARVSTHHGQDVGLRLDALREVATARAAPSLTVCGRGHQRHEAPPSPGLDAMLEACRRGKVDVVAFWRLDRLGRSLCHVVQLLDERAVTEPQRSGLGERQGRGGKRKRKPLCGSVS